MGGARLVRREWTEDLLAPSVRLRCVYQRRGKRILKFTVQLEVRRVDCWHAVVRYDNAHGFCHRDTMHVDGHREKTPVWVGDVTETFTYAIEDLKTHWSAYHAAYLKEFSDDRSS